MTGVFKSPFSYKAEPEREPPEPESRRTGRLGEAAARAAPRTRGAGRAASRPARGVARGIGAPPF